MVLVETFPVGALQCNCTILADEETREAVVIDPGDEAPRIIERLKAHDVSVKYLIHTHAHIDHVLATMPVKREMGGEALLHPADDFLYQNLAVQGAMLGLGQIEPQGPMDGPLVDGQVLTFGAGHAIEIMHTPGHSPGSCCFKCAVAGEDLVFSGDTLFMRGIGRTDLWGGSYPEIMTSISERLMTLGGDTKVIPGHGPRTSIGDEQLKNPFLT